MNLFTGMTNREILSAVLMFLLFNFFVVLEVIALAAFYVTSKPRRGRVRTAALWHLVAAFAFLWSLVSTVWAAPAQKAFQQNQQMFTGDHFTKVIIGLVIALVGILCLLAGGVLSSRQRRLAAREALVAG